MRKSVFKENDQIFVDKLLEEANSILNSSRDLHREREKLTSLLQKLCIGRTKQAMLKSILTDFNK